MARKRKLRREQLYALAAAATALLVAIPLAACLGLGLVWAWFAGINAATFGVYAADKVAAKLGWRRAPENTLLVCALVGGSPSALVAQRVLKHKSSKRPFRNRLWLVCGVHVLALAFYAGWTFAR